MYTPKGKTKKTEDKNHDDQRKNQKVQTAEPHHPEDLECRWSKVLTFGDKIVMVGHFYNGMNKPATSARHTGSLPMTTPAKDDRLRAASGVEFEDDGHAIAWAMQQ